ncbi:hypothetical protein GCK72_010707 [Caenorhabditis remanei]|uniref:RBR-type E3 ubiquitin transferase n=1 Tax=Caenorhabditis remanei TaxID=31234 RepID=A0A6A5H5U8_CAERE|nr:hypothetical protein GCK72_010707 [Caenorhabditis remanei]KAF1762445.1 hypothetical protein GCK72_010707 [Caenorhabditis remanei]
MDSDEDVYMVESDSDDGYPEDEILSFEDLESEMKASISEIQDVIEGSTDICRLLLQKYKWNKDFMLDRFYESPDTLAFLIDANIVPKQSAVFSKGDVECQICCMDGDLSGLACNHLACDDCWKAYLTEKIKEKQSEIECMTSNCKLLMKDEQVKKYLADSAAIASFRKILVNSYVKVNSSLRWCPAENCEKAVKVHQPSESRLLICSCGTRFCFTCGNEGHEPIDCCYLKLWLKRCMDDSETFNWINANTKDCPKCSAPIEKNGGCNYMRCENTRCRYEFCWMCFGSWKNEGAHSCNTFKEKKTENSSRDKSRVSLERYLFYYNRYAGHRKSLELEEKLKERVELKMNEMQKQSMTWVEVQFLPKAVEVLSECRHTLMFTYAFAFYLKKNNSSIIFEENQKDLEQSTEQLSGFLERDLDNEDLVTLKVKVQDKYRYVEQRRKALLDHCAEGKEQNVWVFNE